MTSRRLLLSSLGIGVTIGNYAFAAKKNTDEKKPFLEGTDFSVVVPEIEYPQRPILIHDFFAYTCPHCLKFAPLMESFRNAVSKMDDIKFIPVPVAWEEAHNLFPKVYYGFEALNRLGDLHYEYWEWVMDEDHPWDSVKDAEKDTLKWIARHGIALDRWKEVTESFTIQGKLKAAADTWKHYGIDATPMVGVAGKFLTAPHMTGSRPRTIEMLWELIRRVRAQRT